MDRPEQAFDLIREAVVAAGYSHDSDVNVVLRCCSSDVYDKVWWYLVDVILSQEILILIRVQGEKDIFCFCNSTGIVITRNTF